MPARCIQSSQGMFLRCYARRVTSADTLIFTNTISVMPSITHFACLQEAQFIAQHESSSLQIEVFVKNTATVPSFAFAYTDPKKDVDVSAQMRHGGVVELGLTQMWYTALRDKCIGQNGSRALVVDVGGNFGWYSAYAAQLGCRYSKDSL